MKYLISLLVVCLGAGCATRKDSTPKTATVVPGTSLPAKRMASVRTSEIVKAYPVGRYTDPNFPEEMHEQHTVYRREQSPDWNYLPDPPPTLPSENPSPSYSVDATGELNARQRAYAEALQEQNRAMQKRIEALQKEAGRGPGLQQEIDQLKQRAGEAPKPQPTPEPTPGPPKTEDVDVLFSVEPELPAWGEGVSDPDEITLFTESDNQSQDFLMSQMRLNDEFAAELAAAERRKISAAIHAPFLRRKELALLNQ